MTFAATVLTLYPEMFPGPLGVSLAGRALERGDWSCEAVQIRDFATDKHRTVDDTPAGGGAGMGLKPDVLGCALGSVADERPVLAMTPRGKPIAQERIRAIAAGPGVTILCGRVEGVDGGHGRTVFLSLRSATFALWSVLVWRGGCVVQCLCCVLVVRVGSEFSQFLVVVC